MTLSALGWNFIDNDQQAQNFSEGLDSGAYLSLAALYLGSAVFDLGFLWEFLSEGTKYQLCDRRILFLGSFLNIVCALETFLGCYLRYLYVLEAHWEFIYWSYTLDFVVNVLWIFSGTASLVGYRLVDERDEEGKVLWCPTRNFTLLADIFSVACCVLYAIQAFFYYECYVYLNTEQTSVIDTDGPSLQATMYGLAAEVGNQADFAFLTSCILLSIDNFNSVRYGDEDTAPQVTRRASLVHARARMSVGGSVSARRSTITRPFLPTIHDGNVAVNG